MIIQQGRVLVDGSLEQRDVRVENHTVAAVGERLAPERGEKVIDASDCYVLPGGVDPHVHVRIGEWSLNEEMLDDLEEASRCALLGGVTTLGEYVQSTPGLDLLGAVRAEIDHGRRQSYTDFFVHALCQPGDDVVECVEEGTALGIGSYKAFLGYFGRGRMLEDDVLLMLMQAAARHDCGVLVHAESGRAMNLLEIQEREKHDLEDPERFLRTAPAEVEAEGICRAALLARLAGCRLTFVHTTSELGLRALDWVREAVAVGPVTVETQPHYALLTNDEVSRRGALAKVGPPLKTERDVRAVREAACRGSIDYLSSDHSPRRSEVKLAQADILDAPYGGISGTEVLLPLAFEVAGGLRDEVVACATRLYAEGAARAFGFFPSKGAVSVGADADLVVVPAGAPRRELTAEALHGRSDYTLYEKVSTEARPRYVIKAGEVAVEDGVMANRPRGRYLVPRQLAAQEKGAGGE